MTAGAQSSHACLMFASAADGDSKAVTVAGIRASAMAGVPVKQGEGGIVC